MESLILKETQVDELIPLIFIEQMKRTSLIEYNEGFTEFWLQSLSTNIKYLVVMGFKGVYKYKHGEKLGAVDNSLQYFKKLNDWGFITFVPTH